jgi:hypothetical protein
MIYNTKETPIIKKFKQPTQEQIMEMPNFYGCEVEFIMNHPDTPDFIKEIVESVPWSGKRKYRVVQTRSAIVNPSQGMIGNFWHIDVCIPTYHPFDTERVSDSYEDFISYLITFGNIDGENLANTEFITTPIEMPALETFSDLDYFQFVKEVEARRPFETMVVECGSLVQYSPYNIHRGQTAKIEGYRGGIGCIESDIVYPVNRLKPKLCAKFPVINFETDTYAQWKQKDGK